MLEFVFIFLLLFAIGWLLYKTNKFSSNKTSNEGAFSGLGENELIKKFNSLCDKLAGSNERTIDSISNDMLNILKEYKARKIEQFVESTQMLTKNKRHINEEIIKINENINKLKRNAFELKKDTMSDEDYLIGAMYVSQIEDSEKLLEELKATLSENDKQLERVEKQVNSFNAKYTLKEGSIMNMIIKAKTHKNFSNVDLKLNDLISEFNDKVSDVEIEQKVRAKINGVEHNDDEEFSSDFITHKSEYVEKFKQLINK